MRPISFPLAILSAAILLNDVAVAQPEPQQAPGEPIALHIDVSVLEGKTTLSLNGQVMTEQALGQWLARAQEVAGGKDPIVIRCDPTTTIGHLFRLRQIVLKTHQNVRIILEELADGGARQEVSFSQIGTGPQR